MCDKKDGMVRPSDDGVHIEAPQAQTGSSSEGARSATSGNEAGWMAGWMDGGHARPVGERRKAAVSHDAGSAASWRDPTPPNHNGVTTERRPPAGHLPPFKRHAPIHFDTVEYYEYSIVVRSS